MQHHAPAAGMIFPRKFFLLVVVITTMALIWLAWNTYDSYRSALEIRARQTRIAELSHMTIHLDEVLTMSAQMAAATGDPKWEARYRRFEPQAAAAMQESIELVPETMEDDMGAGTAAGEKLFELENTAFSLIQQGRVKEAQEMLFGDEYKANKRIAEKGMNAFAERLKGAIDASLAAEKNQSFTRTLIAVGVIPIVLIGWLVVWRTIHKWQTTLLSNNRQLSQQAETMTGLVRHMQHSGLQVTSASTELSASSRQLESMMAGQVASTTEVVATATEIAANTQELVQTMNDVVSMSGNTATAATRGRASLSSMEATMQQMEGATRTLVGKLEILQEQASGISSVITTINKVSEQTNLLSLNAAIEAEKAGEYGAGFAVVAREIRRLADQTAAATLDIERLIGDMNDAVGEGVMGMEHFSQNIRKGTENVRTVSAELAQIITEVQALTPRFNIVSEGMGSQAQAARQIRDAMRQLSDEAHQTETSLQGSTQSIDKLNRAAEGLYKAISRIDGQA